MLLILLASREQFNEFPMWLVVNKGWLIRPQEFHSARETRRNKVACGTSSDTAGPSKETNRCELWWLRGSLRTVAPLTWRPSCLHRGLRDLTVVRPFVSCCASPQSRGQAVEIRFPVGRQNQLVAMSRLYGLLFKRTSTFLVTCAAGAYVFERVIDTSALSFYDYWNRGKQWKDIKHLYE